MRLLSGRLKGQEIERPKTRLVRPLGDKVRAALFDVVGDVTDFTVLDAYAGSGAAGFEAISRGAAMVMAVEANAVVCKAIRTSQAKLGLSWGYVLHNSTVESWLAKPTNLTGSVSFDLIIADPPYHALDVEVLERLASHLAPSGVLVVSRSSKTSPPMLSSVKLVQAKVYGDSALSFYQADAA